MFIAMSSSKFVTLRGSAAVMCGKAVPFRGVARGKGYARLSIKLSIAGAARRESPTQGKAKPFPTSLRRSRAEIL
jgi:hypothetical protein